MEKENSEMDVLRFCAVIMVYLLLIAILCFINSGCTQAVRAPGDFNIAVGKSTWKKPFGRCNLEKKAIIINPPKLIPKCWSVDTIVAHELGHVYGIERCENCGCLMYENESRLIEWFVLPYQVLLGLRFCSDCENKLRTMGVLEDNRN